MTQNLPKEGQPETRPMQDEPTVLEIIAAMIEWDLPAGPLAWPVHLL